MLSKWKSGAAELTQCPGFHICRGMYHTTKTHHIHTPHTPCHILLFKNAYLTLLLHTVMSVRINWCLFKELKCTSLLDTCFWTPKVSSSHTKSNVTAIQCLFGFPAWLSLQPSPNFPLVSVCLSHIFLLLNSQLLTKVRHLPTNPCDFYI